MPRFFLPPGVLCSAALLAACSPSPPSPATPGETGQAGGRSYHVVTVERPASATDHHRLQKGMYDMCVTVHQLKTKSPPKPFVTFPADFITARKTYVSDGTSYLFKEERFDVEVGDADQACESRIVRTWTTFLGRDGKLHYDGIDKEGKRLESPPGEFMPPETEGKADHFTEARTIEGIAVKCMPIPPGMQQAVSQVCVADAKPGTLVDVHGEPITLFSETAIVKDMASVLRTEAKSVRIGGKVDQAVFDAVAAP